MLGIYAYLITTAPNLVLVTIDFCIDFAFIECSCDGSRDLSRLFLVELEGVLSGLRQEPEDLHQTIRKTMSGLNDSHEMSRPDIPYLRA